MATEFQSICDDLHHASLTTEDARALIQPAWFLAQRAVQEFPILRAIPSANGLTLLPIELKRQLEIITSSLELNLAVIADRAPGAEIDFYQFKDICHLSQLAYLATAPVALAVPDLEQAREQLAQATARVRARMERSEPSRVPVTSLLFWGGAFGLGLYVARRLRARWGAKATE